MTRIYQFFSWLNHGMTVSDAWKYSADPRKKSWKVANLIRFVLYAINR